VTAETSTQVGLIKSLALYRMIKDNCHCRE